MWFRHLAVLGLSLILVSVYASSASALVNGGHSLGLQLGSISADQEQMNTLILNANTREGGISTSDLDSAYEGSVFYAYRFSGTIYQLQFRPSFFYQSEDGTGASGAHEYSVTGFTIFPILRLYPLENNFMKFFLQFGLGYGRANLEIKEGPFSTEGAGGAFGSLLGLGGEFCFVDAHCMTVEGNYRYLTIERSIASSVNGTPNATSLSQAIKNQELEVSSTDLQVNMSGLLFQIGYTFYF